MSRAIIILLDSFGIGHAADAERFGDKGADTLGHICSWMAENRKNEDGSPKFLYLPNMARLGLEKAAELLKEAGWEKDGDKLMKDGELYKQMFDLQARYYQ